MSYQIVISGHSDGAHNGDVVIVAVDAVERLKELGHSPVNLSGFTNDSTNESVQLTDALVPSADAAPGTEPTSATEAPAETPTETPSGEA